MAIAERLVARVSFSQKLTGPERGPSKYESQRGCRRGMEGGAPWGGSPKQHPPSPVRRTHLQTRKIALRQAGREPAGYDSNAAPALSLTSRLPLPGGLTTRKVRLTYGKHAGSVALRLQGSGGLPLIPCSRRQRGLRLVLSLERAISFESRSRAGEWR